MLGRLFPKQFDNDYRGSKLALWLLVPVAFVMFTQGAVSLFMTRYTMMTADRIAAENINNELVACFALLGMNRMVLPLLSAIALIRYRAMVPLMFLMLLLAQAGARVILFAYPIVRSEGPATGFFINMGLLALTVIGLAFSLTTSGKKSVQGAASQSH